MTKKEFRQLYPGVVWDLGYHFVYLVAEMAVSCYKTGERDLYIVRDPDRGQNGQQMPGTRRMKVREYLQLIPEPVARQRALNNCYNDYGQEWSTSLPAALRRAFLWHRSPEGYAYWDEIYKSLS